MHVVMGSGDKAPVGLLLQLEKPMFESNVGQCRRISGEDSQPDAIGAPAHGEDVACTANGVRSRAAAQAADGHGCGGVENGEATEAAPEGEMPRVVAINRPGAPSLIAKESNTLTLQWDACLPVEEGGSVAVSVEYAVEIQQVEVPSGRSTPDGESAEGLLKRELWKRAATTTDAWTQIRGLRPGRYYAVRVEAIPSCDDPSVQLQAPDPSPVVVFHTTPSVPGAPQPPQLTRREKKSLKFKWNVPETGGLDILEFLLQISPAPANTPNDEDAEGFTEVYAGPDHSFRVLKLQPGSKYTARVKARNELGESPWSLHSVFTTEATVPSTPEAPHQTDVTSTSVSLQWPPAKEHGAKVDSYTVEGEDPESGLSLPLYNGPQTSCVLKGLKSGVSYKFKVRAESQVGKTAWSPVTTVRTAASFPGPPGIPSITDLTRTSSKLNWLAPEETGGTEILSYKGELKPISKAACKHMTSAWTTGYAGPEPTCALTHLRPGCTYQFRVRAANAVGVGSASQCVHIKTMAGPPEELSCPGLVTRDATWLKVGWKPPEHDGGSQVTEYQLQCCQACEVTSAGAAAFQTVYQGNQLWDEVVGLMPGVEYIFRVRALNSCGCGGWSPPLKASTRAGLPTVPSPPTLQESTSYSLTVGWTAPNCQGSPITGYTVQMTLEGGGDDGVMATHSENGGALSERASRSTETTTSGVVAETVGPAAADGGIGSCSSSRSATPLVFTDVYSGTNMSCRIPNLQPYTEYALRLRASNKSGSSEWSQWAVYRTEATAPSPPRGLCAEGVSTNTVSLCWEPPASTNGSKVTTYVLERLSLRNKKQSWVQECQGPDTSYEVSQLRTGREHQFRVRAANRCGVGPPCEPLAVRTAAAPPDPPEAPFFAQKTATTIRVKWNPPDRENGAPVKEYRLEVAVQGGAYREIYSGYATAHKATGLSAGQRYVFRAQAVNEAGRGEWSPESPVVMALAPPPRPSSVSVTARFDDRHEGSIHADATILEVDWHHSDGQEANCTSTASFEVEACPCKDRSSQQRSSAVRQVVLQPPCRLAGLPADTCFAVRVRAVGARSAGHSKWSETAFATTPGWKKARPSTPSESNSSGTMVPASPRSSRSATSIVSEESLQSARGASRSAKKTQLRPRPRLRKSLWKTMKPYFTTSLVVAVVVLFVLLARGNLG